SSDKDGIVRFWDIGPLKEARLTPVRENRSWQAHTGGIDLVRLALDRKHALTLGDDGTARYWEIDSGKEFIRFQGQEKTGKVTAAVLAPDGRRALVCYELGLARVFDLTNQKEILRLDGLGLAVHSAAWSPDGKYFVTAGGNSAVANAAKRLWVLDAASGQF